MPLHLTIENESSLPDGGPINISVSSKRGIDIGRDQYLDWVLPDPTRVVSGKHCEVRFRDGQYWLTDVSTNGTFVNGSQFRLDRPHALRTGDRVEIGRYIVAVVVEPETGADLVQEAPPSRDPTGSSLWSVSGEVAPAINPRELRAPSVSPGINSFDMLNWAADIPANFVAAPPPPSPGGPAPFPVADENDWLRPPPPQEVPRPSRPAGTPPETSREPTFNPPPTDDWGTGSGSAALPPLAPTPEAAPVIRAPVSTAQPAPPPLRPAYAEPATAGGRSVFLQRFARGLGIPEEAVATRDEGELAELAGALIASVAENLRQLLAARAQSKGAMRSANQTMIQVSDNNPLRFSPNVEHALEVMFGRRTSGYLDARATLDRSFADIKKHQVATVSAMQMALTRLLDDLDPKKIDTAVEADRGVSALLGSRKAKLWEHYATAWEAKVGRQEQGMLGVFMQLFAEAYDRSG